MALDRLGLHVPGADDEQLRALASALACKKLLEFGFHPNQHIARSGHMHCAQSVKTKHALGFGEYWPEP